MAEYRELPRIFTAVRKHIEAGKTIEDFDIPDQYVLGKGHVTFFYDKISWLRRRYMRLMEELMDRGFDLDLSLYHKIKQDSLRINPNNWAESNTHFITPEALYLNMTRLCKRSGIESVLNELKSED